MPAFSLVVALSVAASSGAPPAAVAGARLAASLHAGVPMVAHVVVSLCDNQHQGIIPVRSRFGDGQRPSTNLYWGARYGTRRFLVREAGWRVVATPAPSRPEILESVVLHTTVERDGVLRDLYLVAEAWDGSASRQAIERFLDLSMTGAPEPIELPATGERIRAGGAAHLVVFVGHNGLMDFELEAWPKARAGARGHSVAVLACSSARYFAEPLASAGVHPLLLTTSLLAPEAYLLDAVVRTRLTGGSATQVREAAARAYARYQRIGLRGARRLFVAR